MAYWSFNFPVGSAKEYTFDPNRDLTLRKMRQLKGWYGKEFASYSGLMAAIGAGDPDALACLVWIGRTAAGDGNVREPHMMEDFSLIDFMENLEYHPDADDADADPTTGDEAPDTTDDSTQTPKNSGSDTPD